MKKAALFLGVIIICCACTDSIIYAAPQPSGSKDLQEFPKELRGTYWLNDENIFGKVNVYGEEFIELINKDFFQELYRFKIRKNFLLMMPNDD